MAKTKAAGPLCKVNGEAFKKMIIAAAAVIDDRKEEINSLNVFPVPDGDTGTNMSLTLSNAASELKKLGEVSLERAANVTSDAMLRGARGNSGVITSLLFRGVSKALKGKEAADGAAFAEALFEGSATAYKAVMKPAEGTILTVSRVAGDHAVKYARREPNVDKLLEFVLSKAEKALEETTEQNPVLKKAGVVDAGAYGYVLILQAMYDSLSGNDSVIERFIATPKTEFTVESADFSVFDTEEITFSYCTELMIKRQDKRRSPEKLRNFLGGIGDCVVVVDNDELIKVHVHTDAPDKAIGEGLKYGSLINVKIENMREQHEKKISEGEAPKKRVIAPPEKPFGFVAVAAGEGICETFRDLGADALVEGGQTMNPSTEDILCAIDATPAETVFVLPNNKNIILAAQQAAPLSEKKVVVLESRTVPQGITAMLTFDPESEAEINAENMTEAMGAVTTGQITYAARNSDFDGKKIKEGEYLALCDGKLVCSGPKFGAVAKKLAAKMCKKATGFITVFSGEGSSDELNGIITEAFAQAAPGTEINCIPGGQPVYSYIISAE
ncbi:MAG: DAK2 domain-containing protein [Clostridia bacterium]|nr:DAK2 domain-containing protein [Clostridia bacterium]